MSRQAALHTVLLVAAGLLAGLLRQAFPVVQVPLTEPERILELGLASLLAGDLETGREELERVPHGSPAFGIALDNLSTIDLALDGDRAARARIAGLRERYPQDAELRMRLAARAYEEGLFDESAGHAFDATRLAPEDPRARYAVALYRLAAGALPEAIAGYQAAIQGDPGAREAPAALDALWRHAARHPEQAETHFALAFFCSLQGQSAQELLELERYLAAGPSGPTADAARQRREILR